MYKIKSDFKRKRRIVLKENEFYDKTKIMKIAICDDNKESLQELEKDIRLFFQNKNQEISICTYHNGNHVLHAIQQKEIEPDVLFLDIDMPDISGLETAKILRETQEDLILIFISSYEQYVFEALEYAPFRYIRKNYRKKELPLALRAVETAYQKTKKRYLFFKCKEGEYRVEQSEIIYFERVIRKLYIHLKDGRVLFTWKPIKEIEKELSMECFSKVHSGCIVNLKYVNGYDKSTIVLDNGQTLTVSRDRMKVFKSELAKYWNR